MILENENNYDLIEMGKNNFVIRRLRLFKDFLERKGEPIYYKA